ncbi:Endonuclease/Exonuclease/phosphatase family protein [Yoonia tamlensis]|uniref:Endonuclease/Exonuclease/phosphatase family protein n=1 Tax=Yoonia tamlensis TaxID=390270 RepID=A0A1I6GVT9_9RHOB|nr:Endonuclease/Exonuclease/phosphatase family protein [Yoonia tamlensis]
MILLCLPHPGLAQTIRVATYAAPLSRAGPGLLLRDIHKGDDPQITAIAQVIRATAPDVLVLTDFDYDHDGIALAAFAQLLGPEYVHQFAGPSNAGLPTGLDLDGDNRRGDARDAQGYGEFAGDGAIAVLSRWPLGAVTDYSPLRWRDLPGATLPPMTDQVAAVQRLSSTSHWVVPVLLPDGPLNLFAFAATPPVFDGPEDRNGLRNRDELRLWTAVLDGGLGQVPADFVIAGNANLDPLAGDGLRDAMAAFLADQRLQDPLAEIATAAWSDRPELGELRVSYVLPVQSWRVVDAGVQRPPPDDPSLDDRSLGAGPHWLVWVDIAR